METALFIAWLATSTVSVGTTEYAIAHGGYEMNPLMRNRGVRITVNVAVPVTYLLTRKHLSKKQRYIILASATACRTADMIHNIRQVRKIHE